MPPAHPVLTRSAILTQSESPIDHGKSTLARGSRWDYTPLPFKVGISYLSWFYDRGAIKDPVHTGLSQAINRGPIRKFLPKYANV